MEQLDVASGLFPAFLALALIGPSAASGQDARAIPAAPACASCRIVFDTVAVVGSIQDSVLIGDHPGGLVVTSGDTVVVGGWVTGGTNLVFAPDGRLDRTVGRVGQGPGELWMQAGIAYYSEDRLLIPQAGRLSIVGMDGTVHEVKRALIKAPHALSAHPDGRILYPVADPVSGDEGTRYRIFGPDLESIATFGRISREEYQRCSFCRGRNTTWSLERPGFFWSMPRRQHRIELWSDQGEMVEAITIEGADWMTGVESGRRTATRSFGAIRPGERRETTRPSPRLVDIDEDESGLLWISGLAVPADWAPYPGGLPAFRPLPPEAAAWDERRWDTVVEVIDPTAGAVLARVRIPHVTATPTNGRHYYVKRQNDVGVISYVVLRARLVGR